jgi:hypothetical protein
MDEVRRRGKKRRNEEGPDCGREHRTQRKRKEAAFLI